MYRKMLSIFAILFVCSMAGCSDDKAEPTSEPDHQGAEISQTDIPETIGWQGGQYTIEVAYKPLTRNKPVVIFEPWSYRISIDGTIVEENEVTDGDASAEIIIAQNLTEKQRNITVDILCPESLDQTPEWKEVISAVQEAGLIEIDGFYWTPGNLVVKDGVFAIAEKAEDLGFYFKHNSTYGIPSEGNSYQGTAYNPDAVNVALGDIPEENGDPCKLVPGANLRMPTMYEIESLAYQFSSYAQKEAITGMFYAENRLFLPFAGGCDSQTGDIAFKNTNGAYWHSGVDVDNIGGLLVGSEEYPQPLIGNNYNAMLTTVRCVRDIRIPTYVSHSPREVSDNAAFSITVLTDPGDFEEYPVSLFDGSYEIYALATKEKPEAVLQVPENDRIEDVVYELFVNGEPVGETILQPGMKNYVNYKSHTPTGTVSADAFTLTVRCESDIDSFPVEVKCGDESIATATGSKDNLSVELQIPANDGKERVLDIYVNGEKTYGSVTQEKNPLAKFFSVIWSGGYLTVKDGAYTFAGEQELGMYFKFKSRYGMTLDKAPASSANYSGTAYSPAAEEKTYVEITYDDVDPCSLIADGHSWRMPTKEEWDELLEFTFAFEANKYRAYTDTEQTVYLTPSGSIKNTGAGVLVASYVRVWSSTPDDAKIFAVSGGLSSQTSVFKTTSAGATPDIAMMVRCVRAK